MNLLIICRSFIEKDNTVPADGNTAGFHFLFYHIKYKHYKAKRLQLAPQGMLVEHGERSLIINQKIYKFFL